MAPVSKSFARQRAERRIEVHLPMRVRGRDALGVAFEEDTSSENLCRSGAAFLTRFDVAIGSDVEIRIPFSNYATRRASLCPGLDAQPQAPEACARATRRVPDPGNSCS